MSHHAMFEDLPKHVNDSSANRRARQMRLEAFQTFAYQSNEAKQQRAKDRETEIGRLDASKTVIESQSVTKVGLPLKKPISFAQGELPKIADGFIPFERAVTEYASCSAEGYCPADAFETATGLNNIVSVLDLLQDKVVKNLSDLQSLLANKKAAFTLKKKKMTLERAFGATVGTFVLTGHRGEYKHAMVFFAAQRLLMDRSAVAFIIARGVGARASAQATLTQLGYKQTGIRIAELQVAPRDAVDLESVVGKCKGCLELAWMSDLAHDESGATTFHPACEHKVGAPRKKHKQTRVQFAVGDKVVLEHNATAYKVTVKEIQQDRVLFEYSKGVDEFVAMNKVDGRVRALE